MPPHNTIGRREVSVMILVSCGILALLLKDWSPTIHLLAAVLCFAGAFLAWAWDELLLLATQGYRAAFAKSPRADPDTDGTMSGDTKRNGDDDSVHDRLESMGCMPLLRPGNGITLHDLSVCSKHDLGVRSKHE